MKWQREVSIILVFTDEETKVQRDEISSLMSHSKLVAESGFESTSIYHWGSCSTLGCLGSCSTLGCLAVRLSSMVFMASE